MIEFDRGRPVLFDGAFGTYYAEKYGGASCEAANTDASDRVVAIHREYIDAGARAIKTNTYALNSVRIADVSRLGALITAGISLAKAAAGETGVKVFADVGFVPGGTAEDFSALTELFLRGGAENFIFETLPEFAILSDALMLIKERLPAAGVIVSFGSTPDGYTRMGHPLAELIREAAAHPAVDAVGFNCICGPSHAVRLAATLPQTDKPLSVMPNAGYPSSVNGRTVYNDNAEYFASKIREICAAGASILGGCCGTTPAHIAAAAAALEGRPLPAPQREYPHIVPRPTAENAFADKLRAGKRVIAAELDPPADTDILAVAEAAKSLAASGCDVITLADNPLSRARADSIMTAAAVAGRTGLPVMPHLTCRDRNSIAIKSALLAANGLGVRNILAVTGDPLSDSEHGAKSVFAMNSFKLIGYISSLNGFEFAAAPFLIGGALNVNAAVFTAELTRAERKAERGAELLLTQPVASAGSLENLKTARASLKLKLLAGIYPVAGYKNALFLKNEVAGIDIPDELLDALRDRSRDEARDISVDFAAKTAAAAAPYCDGFYVMTPLKRTDIAAALIERIKKSGLV